MNDLACWWENLANSIFLIFNKSVLQVFFYFFSLWRWIRQIEIYIFTIYIMMLWYACSKWLSQLSSLIYFPTHIVYFFSGIWDHLKCTVLANFRYVIWCLLTRVIVMHVSFPEFNHPMYWNFVPINHHPPIFLSCFASNYNYHEIILYSCYLKYLSTIANTNYNSQIYTKYQFNFLLLWV